MTSIRLEWYVKSSPICTQIDWVWLFKKWFRKMLLHWLIALFMIFFIDHHNLLNETLSTQTHITHSEWVVCFSFKASRGHRSSFLNILIATSTRVIRKFRTIITFWFRKMMLIPRFMFVSFKLSSFHLSIMLINKTTRAIRIQNYHYMLSAILIINFIVELNKLYFQC